MIRSFSTKDRIHNIFGASNASAIQEEFSRQATNFEQGWEKRSLKTTSDIMDFVWNNMSAHVVPNINGHVRALDVACGTGIFARKLVQSLGRNATVTGLDITPAMLSRAKDAVKSSEYKSEFSFVQGDAAAMRAFDSETFDLVATRLSVHHFADPHIQMAEMTRVCKPGGLVVIVDIVSSDDPETARVHNELETLRDPSHTRALNPSELVTLMAQSGLEVVSTAAPNALIACIAAGPQSAKTVRLPYLDNTMRLREWMNSTNTAPDARAIIELAMQRELSNEPGFATGMRPFLAAPVNLSAGTEQSGDLFFVHRYVVCVAKKRH